MAQDLLDTKYQIIEVFGEDFCFLNILYSVGSKVDKATQENVSLPPSPFSVITLGKGLC